MKTLKTLLLFLLLSNSLLAKTWETSSDGYWSSASVWTEAQAPYFACNADTFLIRHHVVIDSTLIFDNGCLLFVDSAGGICGHEEMRLLSGVKMKLYGILNLDILYMSGSHGQCYEPGNIILSSYAKLTGPEPTELDIYCEMAVGPWFDCKLPEYGYLKESGISEIGKGALIYPNPFTTKASIHFEKALVNGSLELYNSLGQKVKEYTQINAETFELYKQELSSGVYIVKVTSDNSKPLVSTLEIRE